MEVSFSTWQEAVGFLAKQTNAAIEGCLMLKAQQLVDAQVIAALLHSHADRAVAADLFRQMTSETLPQNHLESLRKDLPDSGRSAFADRVQYWEEVFRASLKSSGPED